MDTLEGRTVLVTGGSSGIGAATARAFAARGARVALAARGFPRLQSLAEEIGGVALVTDVGDPRDVEAMVKRTVEHLGGVDVLVCAAGVGGFGPIADFAIDDWDRIMRVNLRGTFLTCQAALPSLLASQRGGHVFTLASIAATRVFPGAAAYCASKWGLLGFTRVLAEEVRQRGVKVTAVLPGSVDSPFWDAAGGTDLPRARMLHPDDVAAAIVFAACQPPGASLDEITLLPRDGVL